MLAMTYDEGLKLLKSALNNTRGILGPEYFLYAVHAFYAGWMDDPKDNLSLIHYDYERSSTEVFHYAYNPLKNLTNFAKSKKSEAVSFLRPAINTICKAYKGQNDSFLVLFDSFNNIPIQWYDEYWEKAFDEIFSYIRPSMFMGGAEFSQPSELTSLVNLICNLVSQNRKNADLQVYDPFAGIGGFLSPGSNSFAHELNQSVYSLCRLRALALGYQPAATSNYVCADSTTHWANNPDGVKSFDLIVSFPPLGLYTVVTEEMGISWQKSKIKLEDFLVLKGTESLNPGGHLVGIFSSAFLVSDGATGSMREKLVENKRVRMVIQLPSNILSYTRTPLCIVVFSDKTTANEKTIFIDASSFSVKEKRSSVLDIDKIQDLLLDFYKTNGEHQSSPYLASIPNDVLIANNCLLTPSHYINNSSEPSFNAPDGYEILQLKDLVSINNGTPISIREIRKIRGRDLVAEGPIEYESFESLHREEVDGRILALYLDAILVLTVGHLKPTLYKVLDGVPVALGSNVISLIPNQDVDPYYLVAELRKPYVTEQVERLSEGAVIPHLKNSDLLSIRVIIPIERRLQHEAFLTSLRLEKEQQLKSLQFEEYIKRERGRLDAMMSIRRHRINPYISGLQSNVSMLLDELFANEKLTPSAELSPNYSVQDALENMEENLVQLKKLFDAFTVDTSVGTAESIDLLPFLRHYSYTSKMPDRQFIIDKSQLDTKVHYPLVVYNSGNLTEVLDEIIHNAEKHFAPYTTGCCVMLVPRFDGKNVQLLVCNNGEPVPADFDEERSFVAGYHKDENGTGQGLFRVRQICDEFGATIAWENDPENLMPTGLSITFKTSLD